jgi:quinol-cytochrome oxidoreductase complex cytochrome b subunit
MVVVLDVLTASFGVTDYSLPWNQIGYWTVKIETGVPDAIPVIGYSMVGLLLGLFFNKNVGLTQEKKTCKNFYLFMINIM